MRKIVGLVAVLALVGCMGNEPLVEDAMDDVLRSGLFGQDPTTVGHVPRTAPQPPTPSEAPKP